MEHLMKYFLVLAVALFTLSACGGSDPKPDPVPTDNNTTNNNTPTPQRKTVVIYQYRFNPNTLTVPKGTTVVFSNKDPEQHNINIKALNVDQMVGPQKSWSYTFNSTGSFKVTNRLASTPMQATITVK